VADHRDAIYALEGGFIDFNRSTLTLKETRAIIEAACRLYGLDPPRVTHHPGKAYSYSQDNLISFNYQQKNRAIALHESAHYILDKLRPEVTEHHAPEWLDLYCWLLLKFEIMPRAALFGALKYHKIRGVVPSRMSPKKLLGHEPWKLTSKELRKL
jgi:hypothetical protein